MNINVEDPNIVKAIHHLISECGGSPRTHAGDLITQMILNSLKLIGEKQDIGQLKLISRSMKEIRYAYKIFNQYKGARCVSIFGSARTPEHHPDYITAKNFSSGMAKHGWMCITGAANGIMKAGLEGLPKESSFGLSIRLPFEDPVDSYLSGDIKWISFRYFFTRKLMFISHSDAVAAFPGGVGTLDELFEVLTLQQTGKANIVPVVLIEGKGGTYWKHWKKYIDSELLKNGWISPEDQNLFFIANSADEAVEHIQHFYQRYHSSRYVEKNLVIRMLSPLTETQLGSLNVKYKNLIASGEIIQHMDALPEEDEYMGLPRLSFHYTHRQFGFLRLLIDDINDFE